MIENFSDYERRKAERASHVDTPGVITVVDNSNKFHLAKLENPIIQKVWNGPWYYLKASNSPYPVTNLVFVEDRDGNTGSDEPWNLGGGETDFWIYEGFSRVYVDAIIAGSETLKGIVLSVWNPELVDYRVNTLGKRRHPINVITTRRGELDIENELVFNNPELEVVVLTGDEGKAKLDQRVGGRDWVHIESTGSQSDLRKGMQILKTKYGIQYASCIGGRNIATELIDLGLVDEIILTHTPIVAADPNTPFYLGNRPDLDNQLELVTQNIGQGPEEGVTFSYFIVSKTISMPLQKAA